MVTDDQGALLPGDILGNGVSDTHGFPVHADDRLPSVMSNRRYRRAVGAITMAGLAWRIVYLYTAKRNEPALGDAMWYSSQAWELAQGHGFVHAFFGGPTALHPPLTVIVLAPMYWFAGSSLISLRWVITLIGAGVIVLIAQTARRVAGNRAGAIAALIAAAYANFWMNDVVVMSETLATAFVCSCLLALFHYLDEPRCRWALACGALAGLAALTRSELSLLAPIMALPMVLRAGTRPLSRRAVDAVIVVTTAALVISPWAIYNASRFDQTVLLSTNVGQLDYGVNCDLAYYGGGVGYWHLNCIYDVEPPPGADESVRSDSYASLAADYSGRHRAELPRVALARLGRVWELYRPADAVWTGGGEGRERWAARLGLWQFWLLAPLAGGGAVVLRKNRLVVLTFALLVVMVSAVAIRYYGLARLRVPAEIVIVVCAAAALDAILHARSVRRFPRGLVAGALATVGVGLLSAAVIAGAADPLVSRKPPFGVGLPKLIDEHLATGVRGPGWRVTEGSYDSHLVANTDDGSTDIAVHDLPTASYDLQVSFETTATNNGVVFRYHDALNYWRVVAEPLSATWNVVRTTNGEDELVADLGLWLYNGPMRITIKNRATFFRLFIDDAFVKQVDAADLGSASTIGVYSPATPDDADALVRLSQIVAVAAP